jgi:hypothetical protein
MLDHEGGSMSDSLSPQENPAKDPADWTTGDEPMTGPQRSYLQTLAREAGRDVKLDGMSKADASRLIDELQGASGRGAQDGGNWPESFAASRRTTAGSSGAKRFGIIDEMNVIPGAEARGTAAETFRRLYWDTAASWGDPVLRLLRDVVGIDRVVFGTDFPYLRRDIALRCREDNEASPELTDSERTAVLGATAMTLIPRLVSLRSQT